MRTLKQRWFLFVPSLALWGVWALLMLAFVGCGFPEPCYDGHYLNVTGYSVSVEAETPAGVGVDPSGFAADFAEIDRRFAAVEACLAQRFPDGTLPPDLVVRAGCLSNRLPFGTSIKRECLTVKIAPDWHWSCFGPQQVFACAYPSPYDDLCRAKGHEPSEDCPCCWRGAVQNQTTLVTTPDLHLLTNDLLRVVTGCNNVFVPGLQECYVP